MGQWFIKKLIPYHSPTPVDKCPECQIDVERSYLAWHLEYRHSWPAYQIERFFRYRFASPLKPKGGLT